VIWAPRPHDFHGHRLRPPGRGSWAPSSTRAACSPRRPCPESWCASATTAGRWRPSQFPVSTNPRASPWDPPASNAISEDRGTVSGRSRGRRLGGGL